MEWKQLISYSKVIPGIDCESVRQMYGENLINMAFIEHHYQEESKFPTSGNYVYLNERLSRTGAHLCFCELPENQDVIFEIKVPGNTD